MKPFLLFLILVLSLHAQTAGGNFKTGGSAKSGRATGASVSISAGGAADNDGSTADITTSAFSASTGDDVGCAVSWNGGNTIVSATDAEGDTFNISLTQYNSTAYTQMIYALNVTGSGSKAVTVTMIGQPVNILSIACAVVHNTTALETGSDVGNNGSNGNSGTSGALTTTTPVTAILVGMGLDRAGTTAITTGGYTMISQSPSQSANIAGKVTTGTVASETTGWTMTNSPWWSSGTIALK